MNKRKAPNPRIPFLSPGPGGLMTFMIKLAQKHKTINTEIPSIPSLH